MTIQLSAIQSILYRVPPGKAQEASLEEGESQIFLQMANGEEVDCTKPIKVQADDGNFYFLKIPNPCNHKVEITFIETAVATLARQLLTQYEVVVPEYTIRKFKTDGRSELLREMEVPCCLIEAIDAFEPFGECGTDISGHLEAAQVQRLSEEKQRIRQRQTQLMFSSQFASYSAVRWFIEDNDNHQENFGTGMYLGKERLVGIDFDRSVMPFLIQEDLLGPYNKSVFTAEEGYHSQTPEGRFSPYQIDPMRFPERRTPESPMPDNCFTDWCHNFGKGLAASGQEREFRNQLFVVFISLSSLTPFYFDLLFSPIAKAFPESKALMKSLSMHFSEIVKELSNTLTPQLLAMQRSPIFKEQLKLLNPQMLTLDAAQAQAYQLDTPVLSSSHPGREQSIKERYSFYAGPMHGSSSEALAGSGPVKKGGSPELEFSFAPPPPYMPYPRKS